MSADAQGTPVLDERDAVERAILRDSADTVWDVCAHYISALTAP